MPGRLHCVLPSNAEALPVQVVFFMQLVQTQVHRWYQIENLTYLWQIWFQLRLLADSDLCTIALCFEMFWSVYFRLFLISFRYFGESFPCCLSADLIHFIFFFFKSVNWNSWQFHRKKKKVKWVLVNFFQNCPPNNQLKILLISIQTLLEFFYFHKCKWNSWNTGDCILSVAKLMKESAYISL